MSGRSEKSPPPASTAPRSAFMCAFGRRPGRCDTLENELRSSFGRGRSGAALGVGGRGSEFLLGRAGGAGAWRLTGLSGGRRGDGDSSVGHAASTLSSSELPRSLYAYFAKMLIAPINLRGYVI